MRGLLEPIDPKHIRLIPISTQHQARTFLVRWLACYILCRRTKEMVDYASKHGKRAARQEGYKRGIFID
jgi:hypothetical protein